MPAIRHPSAAEAAAAVVAEAAEYLRKASGTARLQTIILPGGDSPRHFLPPLFALPLDWQRIAILPSDERCFPVGHAGRNDVMLDGIRQGTPAQQATLYPLLPNASLGPTTPDSGPLPAALSILGVGNDGHVASLFRHDDLQPGTRIAFVDTLSPDGSRRVSLSSDMLLASDRILFFLGGKEKLKVMEQALAGDDSVLSSFLRARPDCTIHAYDE